MKAIKTIKIVAISLLLIPLLLASGCFSHKPIMCDGSPLCIGFEYYYNGSHGMQGAVAVKGDRMEYDMDNVVWIFIMGI